MQNIMLSTFPVGLRDYRGFYMLYVDKNLNIIPNRFTGCRETFCAGMRHKHNNTKSAQNFSKINTNRLYVLITLGAPFSKKGYWYEILNKMTKSLKIVNSFERRYKWPLSKMRLVDDKRKSVNIPSVLFIGNRKWGISPYLVSLYTLLLRLGKYPWITNDVVNETNHDELLEKLKKVCDTHKRNYTDAMHIHVSINTAISLISNYDELFQGKSKKYHWSMDRLNNFGGGYNEGIRLLAEGKTRYKKLYNKLNGRSHGK